MTGTEQDVLTAVAWAACGVPGGRKVAGMFIDDMTRGGERNPEPGDIGMSMLMFSIGLLCGPLALAGWLLNIAFENMANRGSSSLLLRMVAATPPDVKRKRKEVELREREANIARLEKELGIE